MYPLKDIAERERAITYVRCKCLLFSISTVKCQRLSTIPSKYIAAHSFNLSLIFHSPFIMSLSMYFTLVFMAVALQVFGQLTIEPQPYCHTVSKDFSNNADFWLHATPVLRAHWWFDYVPLTRRQYTDYWTSWKNINYVFALCVLPLIA